jgi:anaerobic magnesium-protoporphyrin IX monomethyl ester cyclase
MKITLINVQISEGNNIVPPLGILYIAAVLEYLGHQLQVFDIDPDIRSCTDEVRAFGPQMIGLSCYTNTYSRARRLLSILKTELPHAIYVCGGVHATAKPVETLTELGVDYLIYGEGERTIAQLAKLIESGSHMGIERIKGLYYKKGGQIKYNGPPDLIDDLDSVPYPARHFLDFRPYLTPPGMIRGYATGRVTTLFTSRGCPYACTYCASHIVQGKKVRRRSVANVIGELEGLVRDYQINGFYICDDVVTLDREWMVEFAHQLEQKRLNLRWACQSRVDSLDKDMLAAMKRAGLAQLDFGVESGSDKTLKTMRKGADVDAARNAFNLTRELGVRSCATFIIGFEGESERDMEETFTLAKEIRADYTAFYFLTPYPGTPVYDAAMGHNWFDPKLAPSEKFTHRQTDLPLMAIELPPERLASIRRRFQNHFFFRNYFHWRNIPFYFSLLSVMFKCPADSLRCFRDLLRSWRLDTFVESIFELHQRWHRSRLLSGQSILRRS